MTSQQQKDRATLVLAAMLAGLATLGPFAIDTYMPSFPAMGRALNATTLEMQQTLSAYLLPFACMMLFHGALTDSFGRRPVILGGLLVFIAASIGCALAQSLPQLLLFRAVQGMSAGTGMVAGRAMIRDIYPGHQAQRVMSMVTMIFGLAPAIAPILGGWLEVWFGWRAIFVFLALFSGLLFAGCHFQLAESLPPEKRHPFKLRPLLANYVKLFGSVKFGLLSSAIALNFAGFFLYVASAPAVIYGLLGLNENQFAYLFVPGIAGVVAGAFVSGRLAGKLSPRRTVLYGYAIMAAAAAFNLVYHALFGPALPWTVLPVMIYAVGMALAMPSITLLVLDLFPDNRGLAASLQGAQQSFFSGLAAGLLSPYLSGTGLALAGGMAALVACGFACWYIFGRMSAMESRA
ncbi:MAG: Bcr/CflA family drug resistance efflux transporter [Betaproteobacteria bacterium]|nr:Bcr/CflA family drug resistance efflux transporter [Betaproteobacteria bacterium]